MSVDLVEDFGVIYTFVRFAPPTLTKGKLDPKTPVLNNGQPWTMVATIQDIQGMQVLTLPEGLRTKDVVKVYTQTKLQVADSTTLPPTLGDRFTYKGRIYEVMKAEDWTDYELPYFKFIASKVEKD